MEKLEEKNQLIENLCKEIINLKWLASVDHMTGILNRRAGLNRLDEALIKAQRDKKSLVICFVDINRLKYINDNYGHCEGDKLILEVSDVLKQNIRTQDFIFRIGGDEFVITFIDSEIHEANRLMKIIDEKIKNIKASEKLNYEVSISYGFSQCNIDKELKLEELIREADYNMYNYKNHNCTNCYIDF